MGEPKLHWYAIKAFWRRTVALLEMLDESGVEYYAQKILPSYIFVHTDRMTVKRMQSNCIGKYYVYADRVTREPSVVPDKENPSVYQKGDKVRVLDGPFKGAEGYVVRIKKDRRLVVTISGVAAIATSYIPMELLEKI